MFDLDPPTLLLAAAVSAGAVLAMAALWVVRRRAAAGSDPVAVGRERARRARELGWAYDETAAAGTVFTLRGESDGVKWKVRFRTDAAQPGKRPTLTWASRTVQGAATELRLIGRARYEQSKAHFEPVIERLSSLILSPRDVAVAQARADFVERTLPAEVGTRAFRERFVVIARNDRLARALIDPKVEGLLTTWGGRPDARPEEVLSVWLDWLGLRVDVNASWASMRDIEHLVSLGLAVARGYRRHAAAPGVTRWMPSRPGHAT